VTTTVISEVPLIAEPSAEQSVLDAQEMLASCTTSPGRRCLRQTLPPSVVAMTRAPWAPSPAAKQSDAVGHEILVISVVPLGGASDLQVLPPSVVASTEPPPNEFSPTAQQRVAVGHDTERRGPVPAAYCCCTDQWPEAA
jgi:hypothetical protein